MTRAFNPFCGAVALMALSVSGCSLPDMGGWFGADAAPVVSRAASAPASPANRAALASRTAANGMIVDAENGCGTSNPFPQPDEAIRWYGACEDGKLSGRGTLVWYRGQRETERNEGLFRAGELSGPAITTYPDGRYIVGSYANGARDGDFVIHRGDGLHVSAAYQNGRLVAQRTMSPRDVAEWRQRRAGGATTQLAQAPVPAPDIASDAAPAMRAAPAIAAPAAPAAAPAPRAPSPAPSLMPSSSYGDPRWQTATPDASAIAEPRRTGAAPPAGIPAALVHTTPGSQLAQLAAATGPMPRTPLVRRPTPGFQTPAALPAAPGVPSPDADALFTEAYQYERAGQPLEAARRYDRLLMTYPSAPSALLANARLTQLRGGGTPLTVTATPAATVAAGARRVVPVNAPSPGNTQRPASLNPSLVADSPALYRTVCTRDGLYESNAGWCGVVTGVEPAHFRIEVRRIHLRGFLNIGITRSACTGNTFLNWFSRGAQVRVPQQCMTFQG